MNFRVKSAQISIFIVIGIIFIVALAFIFTFESDNIPIFADDTSSYKVREFVESCIELESIRAINLIGQHSGWLYHQNMLFTDRSKPKQFNKRAQGLDFLERQKMPYWYYYDDSSGQFRTNIPDYDEDTRYSIRNQIRTYLDENLQRNCIQGFQAFEGVYKINFEPKEIKSKVEFKDEDIIVSLNLPLEIIEINTNNTEYIDKFENKIYNDLRVPYSLAKDITLAELNSSFIEKRIINFITPYQDATSRDLLPPFYDFKITYDFRPWDLKKTIPLIEQIISSNLDAIQFYSTNYNVRQVPNGLEANEFAQSLVQIHTKDYLTETTNTKVQNPALFKEYKDYTVETNYIPSLFPSSISIYPSSGDVVLLPRPEAVINIIPIFFTEYVAVYEMTLPILFQINPTDSQDFVFNLALEANIDHNTPLSENRDLNLDLNELELDFGKSLVCDPPQFISEFITLEIKDPIVNGERFYDQETKNFTRDETGVDDAIVTFDCSGISTCFMGQTQIVNDTTKLKFRAPINCDPGTLEVYKFGHQRLIFENLNPTLDEPIDLGTKNMPSSRTIPLKIELQDFDASKYAQGKRIGEDENAFLIIENLVDEEATQVIEITNENQDNLNISLLPGNYSLQGFVIYNKNFTIPSEKICYDTGVIFSDKDCQTLPHIDLSSWVRSGIELDKFEITLNTLISREEFVVNMIDFGIPTSYSALQDLSDQIGDLDEVSKNFEPYFE